MLNKILSLTYNEILKQVKKKSVQIIIGLIFILAIVFPIIINNINKTSGYDKYDIENLNTRLNNVNKQIEILKSDKTEKARILMNNLEKEKRYVELSKAGKIGYYDWRKEELNNYSSTYSKIFLLKEILNNTNLNVILENAREVNSLDIERYSELSKEQLKKEISILEKDLKESENIILQKDYIKYITKNTYELEQRIDENKKSLEVLKRQLKKNTNNNEVKIEINNLTERIDRDNSILNIDKYRLNNKINFEKDNWKNNALNDIKENVEDLKKPLLTKEEFNKNKYQLNIKMNYEEYKKQYEEKSKELKDSIDIKWYSLKNNKPQLDNIEDARSILNTVSNQHIILTILTLIIIGGGIIATEFSKGTIRLLLIRPVSRGKVLFSKLLALLIIGYGIIISAILISTIVSGIIFGFKTLGIPILKVASDKIIEVSFIQYLAQNVLLTSMSFVFITALVFMLSTVTKNIAISVALSMILYLGSMPLTAILLTMNIKWIANTFLPYINQAFFNLMPSFVEILRVKSGVKLNSYNGAIQLFLISIVLIGIAFITFIKKDIKN